MSAACQSGKQLVSSLLTSLVAWYSCHEPPGTSRLDSSSNNNTISEQGGTVGQGTGLFGLAASFVATNYLKLSSKLLTAAPYSISCWFNMTDVPGGTYTIVSNGGVNGPFIAISGGLLSFSAASGHLYSVTAPVPGIWTHAVATHDGTTGQLYVNGVLQVSSVQTTLFGATVAFTIGALATGTTQAKGLIQGVGIWSKVLTPYEVAALFNSNNGSDYPFFVAA